MGTKSGVSNIIYILLFICVIFGGQWLIESLGEHHYETQQETGIYDVAHRYLPDLHQYQFIINIIPIALLIYTLWQPLGLGVLRDTFFMALLVLFIRTLTASSTILPKHEACKVDRGFLTFLNGGCYDKLFSGHIAFVTLLTLNLMRVGSLTTTQFWVISAVNALLMLITRGHYTADVILGFLIAYLVYDGNYSIFRGLFKDIQST
jgi:hypothetical protein